MADLKMRLKANTSDIASRVEAMAIYMAAAQPGDPLADTLAGFGEIDAGDIDMVSDRNGDVVTLTATPKGGLAKALNLFESAQR